jgi:hypothetical protein
LRRDLDAGLGTEKVADLIALGRRHDMHEAYSAVERALESIRTISL